MFGVISADLEGFRHFTLSANIREFLDRTWSCYISSKDVPMGQVMHKTSLGLCKVHLRTSSRFLGGLVLK